MHQLSRPAASEYRPRGRALRSADGTAARPDGGGHGGGDSGIGLALVEAFLAEGMNVVMSDVNPDALELRPSGSPVTVAPSPS